MSEVFLPKTLEEVHARMQCSDDEERPLLFAGGTDLFVRMRDWLKKPSCLIGLEQVSGLDQISCKDGWVQIGSMVTHQALLESPIIRNHISILHQAVEILGSPPIRHMGTIGGNICTASPAGDTLGPLYALGAQLELSSADETRVIPIRDFIAGPGKTGLKSDEILTAVLIPVPDPDARGYYQKVGQRRALAISIISMAALILLDSNKQVQYARFAFGSVGPTVLRFPDIEASLIGRILSPELVIAVGKLFAERICPISDIRASADYRRMVTERLPLKILEYE